MIAQSFYKQHWLRNHIDQGASKKLCFAKGSTENTDFSLKIPRAKITR